MDLVLAQLQQQHGGARQVEPRRKDADGSVYASVGTRPVPPPKALRAIHAERQRERQEREEQQEAEVFEREMGMTVKESRTLLAFDADVEPAARRLSAQEQLEVELADTACRYEIAGCGLGECDGSYVFMEASSSGAPVYEASSGWVLHRQRVPELAQLGEGDEGKSFGWLISKDGKPFYGVRSEAPRVPGDAWQCFYGPPPPPSQVVAVSWEDHFLKEVGDLKARGNAAMKEERYLEAERLYTQGLDTMQGYDQVLGRRLRDLRLALRANRAEASLRRGVFEAAAADGAWVLDQDPCHAKAAVRLAKASKALKRLGSVAHRLERLPELQAWYEEAELLRRCGLAEALLTGRRS
ncbi:unnamed protein product [Effrenium voratum]|uniref:Uncharacterized protein n=1 Tax=Effrenium voratum TaxID=2562239 RepID=A0AA36HZ06_9DINO|nr:unnamed protein product [Effrenium voratum]